MKCRLFAAACLAMGLSLMGANAPAWRWTLPTRIDPPSVPAGNPMTSAKVDLGRRLFYDADLSLDGTMSCATCHVQRHGFADSVASRPGVGGDPGRRNAPGLANVAWLQRLTFADPQVATLEQQTAVPIFGTHPVEMGMAGREAELVARLVRDDCYRAMFALAFPSTDRITIREVGMALASFQRSMISFGSAFDRGTMPAAAIEGQGIFKIHCATCHSGKNFTDQAYHGFGPADAVATDQGLFEKTGISTDRGRFRTPSLRNVALTAPYWHDGAAKTLSEAVARHGIALSGDDERKAISAFLDALTDEEFVARKVLGRPAEACSKPL